MNRAVVSRSRTYLGLLFVAHGALSVLGSAGCDRIDWPDVVDAIDHQPGARPAPDPRPTPTDPCAAILCPVQSVCKVQQVMCVKAPCPPVAECVPIPPPPASCAAVSCLEGNHCVERQVMCVRAPCPTVAECVPNQ